MTIPDADVRLSTGMPGCDEVLGGGLVSGRSYLIRKRRLTTVPAVFAPPSTWRHVALANGAAADTRWEGADYLAVCDVATGIGGQDALAFASGMTEVMRGARREFSIEYNCDAPDRQCRFIVRVTRFPDGGPMRLVIAHENITQAKLAQPHLSYLAHHDSLTDLPNRALLRERPRQAIAMANRHGYRVWVIFLDIDRFKFVNDTLGHKAGDTLLKAIAARLKSVIRETDTLIGAARKADHVGPAG